MSNGTTIAVVAGWTIRKDGRVYTATATNGVVHRFDTYKAAAEFAKRFRH